MESSQVSFMHKDLSFLGDHANCAIKLCPEENNSFVDSKSVHLVRMTYTGASTIENAVMAIRRLLETKLDKLQLYYNGVSATKDTFTTEYFCNTHRNCQ